MGKNRLYSLKYNATREPVYLEDFGQLVKIAGIVVEGMESQFMLLLPTSVEYKLGDEFECLCTNAQYVCPTPEEWCAIIARTDDPLIFEQDKNGIVKAIHRKVQRAISGGVQWQVWRRDGFQCLYCGTESQPLTVDHFIPLELSGEEGLHNYVSACRRCAKDKGSRDPKEFCESKGYDYEGLIYYLEGKCTKKFIAHLAK